jgi:uracil-DNA glycosylase
LNAWVTETKEVPYWSNNSTSLAKSAGLELGYRGGRRTGLAMTDDERLARHAALFDAKGLESATNFGPSREITASAVWEAVDLLDEPVFLWNIFPLHPHKDSEPLSNRRHTRFEREACAGLLDKLLGALKPELIIGIGRDAQRELNRRGISNCPVRHPAYGGKTEFLADIKKAHLGK